MADIAYKVSDKVRTRLLGGKVIGTIDKIIYRIIDGKETDEIYAYRMTMFGEEGYMVFPEQIIELVDKEN